MCPLTPAKLKSDLSWSDFSLIEIGGGFKYPDRTSGGENCRRQFEGNLSDY